MEFLTVLFLFLLDPVDSRSFEISWNSNSGYMHSTIQLGTPPQSLEIEIDFSSTDFYVIDSASAFNSGSSTSLSKTTNPFSAYYHDEQQSGIQASDKFFDTESPNPLKFGIISRPTTKLTNARIAGLLGLGLWKEAGNSFTEALLEQSKSKHANFYVSQFIHTPTNQISVSGTLTIGSVNTLNCRLSYSYEHLDSTTEWIINIGQVSLGTDNVRGGRALISPNIRYIGGPQPAINILRKGLNATFNPTLQEHTIDCSRVNSLPFLILFIHGHQHVVSSREYTLKSNDGSACILLLRDTNERNKHAEWILGSPLLRNNCLLFDFEKKRIAFVRPIKPV